MSQNCDYVYHCIKEKDGTIILTEKKKNPRHLSEFNTLYWTDKPLSTWKTEGTRDRGSKKPRGHIVLKQMHNINSKEQDVYYRSCPSSYWRYCPTWQGKKNKTRLDITKKCLGTLLFTMTYLLKVTHRLQEFEDSLHSIVRPWLKVHKPGM